MAIITKGYRGGGVMGSAPRILIVGTGAMGTLFAARLAAIGAHVIVLGTWQEGLHALRSHGARLIDEQGKESHYSVEATDDPNRCIGAQMAVVLVKSWQTERASRQLARCLHSDGVALTLQNGLTNHGILERHLGAQRTALGVTTTGATMLDPGRVRQVGDGHISVSLRPGLEPLMELLELAGFTIVSVRDSRSLVWGKLVINASINPLTALLQVPNGELLERPHARTLMKITAIETAEVAAGCGINLPYPDPVLAVESVASRTAANYSSMLSDVMRGFPTEIDAINGAIVQVGEEEGIPTPINHALWLLVKALETPFMKSSLVASSLESRMLERQPIS